MCRIIIHGEPQGKARPRWGNGQMYTSKKTQDYEQQVCNAWMAAGHPMFEGAVRVTITAYCGIPKSATKKKREGMERWEILPTKRPDVDNIAKIILDGLNGVAYKDDAQVVDLRVKKLYGTTPLVLVDVEEM